MRSGGPVPPLLMTMFMASSGTGADHSVCVLAPTATLARQRPRSPAKLDVGRDRPGATQLKHQIYTLKQKAWKRRQVLRWLFIVLVHIRF